MEISHKCKKVRRVNRMKDQRLLLRNSVFEDCRLFAQWETDPHVTEFFTIDDSRNYEEITREFFEREGKVDEKQFTVCIKETGEAIGRIYVSNIDSHYDSLDITRIYIADPANRGKGYGEEALRLALRWAFEEMNMERVTLDHFRENKVATALYKKVGFVDEGVMRNSGKKNGRYVDLCLMSMLRDEYFK